jgi:hypothetical protein
MSSWDPEDLQASGVPSKNLINLYKIFGEGGIGLILSGNILIDYDHLEAAGNAVISSESGPLANVSKRLERWQLQLRNMVPCLLARSLTQDDNSNQTYRNIPSLLVISSSKATSWARLSRSLAPRMSKRSAISSTALSMQQNTLRKLAMMVSNSTQPMGTS